MICCLIGIASGAAEMEDRSRSDSSRQVLSSVALNEPFLQLPTQALLTNLHTGMQESLKIVSINREHGAGIDQAWWNGLGETLVEPGGEPDSEWRWRSLISQRQNKPTFAFIGLTTTDGEIQAAMIYQRGVKSVLHAEKMAVFVDRIATAPRNRHHLVRSPKYSGCGTQLLAYAAAASYLQGAAGRVILIASANEDWYTSRGCVKTDQLTDDGPIFELPAENALRLMTGRGVFS